MRALITTTLAALLVACGGGGGGAAPAAAPVPAVAQVAPVAFIAVESGDSTTAGYSPGLSATAIPPMQFAAALLGITGVPDGHGGQTLTNYVTGADDGTMRPVRQRMRESGAQAILVNYALNDAYGSGQTLAQYEDALREVIAAAHDTGMKLALMTPNPIVDSGLMRLFDYQGLQARVMLIRQYGQAYNIPVCDKWDAVYAAGLATPENYADGVHPSPALAKWIGENVTAPCIRKLRGY